MDEGEEKSSKIKLDIRNDSSSEIDVDYLMGEKPSLRLEAGKAQVLIIHTHGSEAYTPADGEDYVESDPYRTEDKAHNVIKVGDVLAQVLEAKGIGVIHDRELYDSPSYTGSYTRSGEAIEKYLKKYPSISVVIDLHRDAIGSGDMAYKTKAEPSLGSCAQIMLLIGTGDNGLYHPDWHENMRLALFIQQAMEQRYPSLARPLAVKSERYNQHLSRGAMIVEVGTNGNTLAEAIAAISYFGEAAGDVLKSLTVYE
ncbi:MAG: stage II sporulation protein P [Oscillospiraceae bacterium]|nr:stage II sporulation protein P [Oscillospiraceae bacterium]